MIQQFIMGQGINSSNTQTIQLKSFQINSYPILVVILLWVVYIKASIQPIVTKPKTLKIFVTMSYNTKSSKKTKEQFSIIFINNNHYSISKTRWMLVWIKVLKGKDRHLMNQLDLKDHRVSKIADSDREKKWHLSGKIMEILFILMGHSQQLLLPFLIKWKYSSNRIKG